MQIKDVTLNVEVDVPQVAEALCELNSDEQAQFLNTFAKHLRRACEHVGGAFDFQALKIVEQLDEDGREFIERLHNHAEANPLLYAVVRSYNDGSSGEQPGHDECFVIHGLSRGPAEAMAETMNDNGHPVHSTYYYKAVREPYNLATFEV